MATRKTPSKTKTESASGFVLGSGSRRELEGVHPDLVAVVERAIELTEQDFTVHSGLRTAEEQAALHKRGASQRDGYKRKSEHQAQASGYGHAVDLVPYIEGKLRWEWKPIYKIAAAMRDAAVEKGLRLRWGGVWDRDLNDIPCWALEAEVKAYCKRHPGPDFIDGPHYEIS
jgi:peptidoglycan L-alanyl-D-glutamate endopeptidase CwlK